MRRLLSIGLGLTVALIATAQEINCKVTVNSDQIEGSNKQIYQTLQTSVEEFMSQTKFTQLNFTDAEKIQATMLIVVSSVENNIFKCQMTLQSKRPVYNSNYQTTILNLQDQNFTFQYQEFDRLDYQSGMFTTNLTAMLTYYAYLIIGEDMDTYSKLGGQPYFQICEQIVQLCQSASMETNEQIGWKAFESNRNRYALCSNLLDEAFRDYREYIYTYHRLGLDRMADTPDAGRANIAKDIMVLKTTYRARPATYAVNTFLDAKSDEYVDIFTPAPEDEKKQVYEVLTSVDPTRTNTYDKMNKR